MNGIYRERWGEKVNNATKYSKLFPITVQILVWLDYQEPHISHSSYTFQNNEKRDFFKVHFKKS